MNKRRFFSVQPIGGDSLTLDGEEFHHITTVMRARAGDELEIVDGRGKWARAVITKLGRCSIQAEVIELKTEDKPPARVIIAPSLTKSHAMNWMIEKLSEMGVDEIRPVVTERTDAQPGKALREKWEKIASQSLKVNRRLWRTEIRTPVSLMELISVSAGIPNRVWLEIEGSGRLRPPIRFPVMTVIGPPGDFTEAERTILRESGFTGCRINDAVLKTETAAMAVAAILKND
jgi:16S rRNA (uracil1498-N3)-methyltransferase